MPEQGEEQPKMIYSYRTLYKVVKRIMKEEHKQAFGEERGLLLYLVSAIIGAVALMACLYGALSYEMRLGLAIVCGTCVMICCGLIHSLWISSNMSWRRKQDCQQSFVVAVKGRLKAEARIQRREEVAMLLSEVQTEVQLSDSKWLTVFTCVLGIAVSLLVAMAIKEDPWVLVKMIWLFLYVVCFGKKGWEIVAYSLWTKKRMTSELWYLWYVWTENESHVDQNQSIPDQDAPQK